VGEGSSPSGGETIGIRSKTGARHPNRHQERFRSTPDPWRHKGEHWDQKNIPVVTHYFHHPYDR
jgi:hypothetical protein